MSFKGDTDQGHKESGEPGTNGSTETFLSLIISNITAGAQCAGLCFSRHLFMYLCLRGH